MTAAWWGVTRGESIPRPHTARHTQRRRRPAPRMTAGRRSDWICVTRGSRTDRPTPGPLGLLPARRQLPSPRVARIAVIGLTVADVIVLPDSEPREATGRRAPVRGACARRPARSAAGGRDALPRRPARSADPARSASASTCASTRPPSGACCATGPTASASTRSPALAARGAQTISRGSRRPSCATPRGCTQPRRGRATSARRPCRVLARGGRHLVLDAQGPLREARSARCT